MSHATVVEPAESPLTPESWGKLGMWVFLAGDAMSFGALLAAYGAMRAGSSAWPVPQEVLGISLTAFMTFLLICSSLTMVKGLSAIKSGDLKGMVKYLLLTAGIGAIFLGALPFLAANVVMVILIAVFPDLVLWLPSVLME